MKALIRMSGEDRSVDIPQSIANLYKLRNELFDISIEELRKAVADIPETLMRIELPEINSQEQAIDELHDIICGFLCQQLGIFDGKTPDDFHIELYDTEIEGFEFFALILDFSEFDALDVDVEDVDDGDEDIRI